MAVDATAWREPERRRALRPRGEADMMRSTQILALTLVLACSGACGGGGGGGTIPPPFFVSGPLTVGLPVAPRHLELGFVDDDAHPDAILGGDMTTFGAVRTWGVEAALGRPDGTFVGALPTPGILGGETSHPLGMRTGYFDLDARLDLVAFADLAGQTGALVCRGDDRGAFAPVSVLPAPLGHEIVEVMVVDANEDFLDDLAFATDQARVGFLLANGLGGFVPGGLVALPVVIPVRGLAVTDVDRDGHMDVLALQSSSVQVVRGDGLGGATLASALPISGGADPQGIFVDLARRSQWLAIPGRIPVAHVSFYRHDGFSGFDPNTDTRVDLRDTYDLFFDATFAVGPAFDRPRFAVLAVSPVEQAMRLFVVRTEDLTIPAEELVPAMYMALQVAATDLDGDLIEDLVLSGFDIDSSVSPPREAVLLQTFHGTRR